MQGKLIIKYLRFSANKYEVDYSITCFFFATYFLKINKLKSSLRYEDCQNNKKIFILFQ